MLRLEWYVCRRVDYRRYRHCLLNWPPDYHMWKSVWKAMRIGGTKGCHRGIWILNSHKQLNWYESTTAGYESHRMYGHIFHCPQLLHLLICNAPFSSIVVVFLRSRFLLSTITISRIPTPCTIRRSMKLVATVVKLNILKATNILNIQNYRRYRQHIGTTDDNIYVFVTSISFCKSREQGMLLVA